MLPNDAPPVTSGRVCVAGVWAWREALRGATGTDDEERWELLRALEELKGAAEAAQARISVEFDESQRRQQELAGVPARRLGQGVAAQVALARRESPHQGQRHLGLARILVHELPLTLAALERGETTQWRASIVARETACLTRADRAVVDTELSTTPGGLAQLGDHAVEQHARTVAYRLDGLAFTRRAAKAEADRRVSLRPAPDTMSWLGALLPVRQGVAVFAALTRQADSLRSAGDERSRGQVMADVLVERVTGQSDADGLPVELNVVMTDQALLSGDPDENAAPAHVEGYGAVPASLARQWIRDSAGDVWVRRLYADAVDGSLVAMDSRRRCFRGNLRRFVVARDQVCRTPWCGAPIRHIDHAERAADEGPTSADNAQGLCQACNLAKDAPGWGAHAVGVGPPGLIETRTPTGQRFTTGPPSLAPPRRGASTVPVPASRLELFFRHLVLTA